MEFSRVAKKSIKREKPKKVQKQGAYLLGGVFLRNFYTVFNWESKQIEFGLNREATDYASIKPAEKAFTERGKPNPSLESMKMSNATSPVKSNQARLTQLMSGNGTGPVALS